MMKPKGCHFAKKLVGVDLKLNLTTIPKQGYIPKLNHPACIQNQRNTSQTLENF